MTDAQQHTLTADSAARPDGTGEGRPRVLILPLRERSGVSAASFIAAGLAGEGWPACPSDAQANPTPGRWASLRSLIRRISACDVVHITCTTSDQILQEALPTLVLVRFMGRRSVLHFLTSDIETLLEKRRRWLAPVLRLADSAVVGSRHLQRTLTRIGLDARALTAPVATDGLVHRVRTRLQPRILVATRLEADANVPAAIRAFRLVKQKYPRAELVIVGDGTQRYTLENLVRQGNVTGVEFRGDLPGSEFDRVLEGCDVFLHAPLADESPSALVRAFAAGVPVVASDADGLLHMVRDRVSAMIVPIGDHVALSDAVLELIENEELCARLSAQGKLEAEKYSWSRVRQDWVNLYNTLRSTS